MKIELYDTNFNKLVILKSKKMSNIDGEIYNIILTEDSKGIPELTFILPLYITVNGEEIENHRWTYVKNERYVFYIDDENKQFWFRIKSTEDIHDINGTLFSNIQCKHTAFDLTKRGYDKSVDMVDNATNILTQILSGSGWTVGTVDAVYDTKTRSFKNEDQTNTIDMLQKVSELFSDTNGNSAYLRFNMSLTNGILTKTVDMVECIGNASGQVQFRYKKNLKNIKRSCISDDLLTRMYCYGGSTETTGTIDINDVNPIKEPFIQNFQYFIDSGELDASKQAKITQYNNDITIVNTNINNTLTNLNSFKASVLSVQSELDTKQLLIQGYNQQITGLTNQRNYYQATDAEYTTLTNQINKLTNLVSYLTNGYSYNAAGTVSITTNSNEIVGTGTSFSIGNPGISNYDKVTISGQTRIARFILGDTQLQTSEVFTTTASGQTMGVEIVGITSLQSTLETNYTNIYSYLNSLYGNVSSNATGTVSITSGSNIVTGVGTQFITAGYKQYDKITINDAIKYIVSVDSETRIKVSSNYSSSLSGQTATINKINDNPNTCPGGYYKNKRDIENQFKIDLDGYIFEGRYQDTAYINSQDLYDDSVALLRKNAYPQITFEMSVLDLSSLTGYELEKIHLGDRIYAYDELLGVNLPLKITKTVKNLEDDRKTQIEISNYTTVFQDLFRQLIKSSDTIKINEQNLRRSGIAINPDGTVNNFSLQNTLNNNPITVFNGINNGVTLEENGIVMRSSQNPNNLTRIDGGDILFSNDNGSTWNTLYSSNGTFGFNLENLLGGNLDVSNINIISGETKFFWNKIGLYAQASESPNLNFVLFNKDGLVGYKNGIQTFQLSSDGSLTLTGTVSLPNAGMTDVGNLSTSTRFWAGDSYANRDIAPFRVDQNGNLYAKTGNFQGTVGTTADRYIYVRNKHSYYKTTFGTANSNLVWIAKAEGVYGNYTQIEYISTGSLSVSRSGSGTSGDPYKITVNINNGVTTALNVKTAIEADTNCNATVFVVYASGNDGSGVVSTLSTSSFNGYQLGSDTIGDGTENNPYKTITKALSTVPQIINHYIIIKVCYESTSTNPNFITTEEIIIQNFTGSGTVSLGGTNNNFAFIPWVDILNNNCSVGVGNFSAYSAKEHNDGGLTTASFYAVNNMKVSLTSIKMIHYIRTGIHRTAFYINNGYAMIAYNKISEVRVAIQAVYGATITSWDNIGNADEWGLIAFYTATIGKMNTQPTGTIANESAAYGGEIR